MEGPENEDQGEGEGREEDDPETGFWQASEQGLGTVGRLTLEGQETGGAPPGERGSRREEPIRSILDGWEPAP
ncbi:Hypothetical protein AA314_08543 [Archangium gephyra]|uniref:Uncharacterized protein n=1 Tax=Archangium gephyra TaxID=48 RepID=A0AAC8TI40_9BACT|nr:Hypothetical protein AA314_08543 [Archangium gephyra]